MKSVWGVWHSGLWKNFLWFLAGFLWIISTVSNWGALGLAAALGHLPDEAEYHRAYQVAVELGYVDGVTGTCEMGEDGFPLETGKGLLLELQS